MKQIKIILSSAAMLFCVMMLSTTATAQSVTGYTSIDYYEDTNTVDAYSETDEDYDAEVFYGIKVSLNVLDQNQTNCGYDTASDDGTAGYVSVEVEFSGAPDSTYTAIGVHHALSEVWDYEYHPYFHMVWYDYYDFSDFAAEGIQTPIFYNFIATGPEVTRPIQPILLGGTTDEASVQTPSQKPSYLVVLGSTALSTGSGGDYGCPSTSDYGIEVATQYQVYGEDSQPLQNAKMIPQEKVTNLVINGQAQSDPQPNWGDIGPTRNSHSSRRTDSSGQFYDAPFGSCDNHSFTQTLKQEISILIGSKRYSVRTNNFTLSTSSSGQGSVSNGSDIQKSRP